jgi:hypothetical protein
MHPQRTTETLAETRTRLQKQINALRQKRNTYAAYHDATRADQLLPAIAELERQLGETHKPGRKPTQREEITND